MSELKGLGEPHARDVELYKKLKETIGSDERRALELQNMEDVFKTSIFDGCRLVNYTWAGVSYEFEDSKVNAYWLEFRKVLSEFMIKLASYTTTRGDGYSTVKTAEDGMLGQRSELAMRRGQEINDSANMTKEKLDAFDKVARKRLRVAA